MKFYPQNIRLSLDRMREKFHPDDEMTRSRANLIAFGCTSSVVANLIGGSFLTGMLLYLDATTVQIGLVNILSYICNLLQLFAPLLLERFAHRKKLLIATFILIRVLNIVCISLATLLPVAGQIRVYIILIFIALMNIANSVWGPGASVWHIQCVPERERANYFSVSQRLTNVVVYIFLLSASAFSDFMKGSGRELGGYLILRAVAAVFCILEVFFVCRVKEYPYVKGEPIHIKSIVTEPFRHKRYLLSILIVFLWNMLANTTSSYFTVYLLEDVKVSYLFLNIVSAIYVPIVLFTMPLWSKLAKKHSWFNLAWKALSVYSIFIILHILIMPGYKWVYIVIAVGCHLFGVGINLVFANLTYYNIPQENQTVYMAFYSVTANLAALLGTTYATRFATAFDGHVFNVLGLQAQTGQFMQMITGFYLLAMSVFVFFLDRYERKKYGPSVGSE